LITALFVVLSLLHAQLALASYVCPANGAMAAVTKTMAPSHPCESADPVQPVLCHGHCSAAAQSVEIVKLPTPTLPMVVQTMPLPPLAVAVVAPDAPIARAPDLRPPPDPLFLATLRLRV
jgi:hypothetical protein